MKVEKQTRWLDKKTLTAIPTEFQITDVVLTKNEQGKAEYLLFIKKGDDFCKLSLFGKNLNFLIDTFGLETDDWKGKKVKLTMEQQIGTDTAYLVIKC